MQGTTIAGHYGGPISAVAVKMIVSREIIKVFL
jgi:RNA binding exosome subunit